MKEAILPETRFGLLTTKEPTKNKEIKKGKRHGAVSAIVEMKKL